MKKASKAFFSVVIMLTLSVLMALSASAASQKDSVYSYLTEKLGFNSAAACGIMANIEHESNFNPRCVIIDCNGLPSGGLCQWNGSRFRNLKNFCYQKGYNYLSTEGQLEYLKHELTKKTYKHIYNYLKSVPNSAQGAYNAAYYWCYYFEIPTNRVSKGTSRGNAAKSRYWNSYGQSNLKDITLKSSAQGGTLDFADEVKITWSKAGESCTGYVAYLVKKVSGEYDYKNAKKVSLDADKKSYTFNLSKSETGKYKAYVKAKSSWDSKESNSITFTLKCKDHEYKCETTKKATAKEQGINTYTCKKCGKQYKKSIPIIITENSGTFNIKKPVVKSVKGDTATITLGSKTKVDGYQIYKYNGEKWVKVKNTQKDTITLDGLKSGRTYKFRVRAYKLSGKAISAVSHFEKFEVATSPDSTFIRAIGRPSDTSAIVSWAEADGANGYIVYAATSKKGKYEKIAEVKGTDTSCTVSGLKKNKQYFFKVQAVRTSQNNTAYSEMSK